MNKIDFFCKRRLKKSIDISSFLYNIFLPIVFYCFSFEQVKSYLKSYPIFKFVLILISIFLFLVFIVYLFISIYDLFLLKKITIKINKTEVIIKFGDIFKEKGLKAIPFDNCYNMQVDNIIICENSLHGFFLNKILSSDDDGLKEIQNISNTKHALGHIERYKDFLLVAFSKLNKANQASLKLEEYMACLLNFWNEVNIKYAQKDVCIPIFGTGITRIEDYIDIEDEKILEIILFSFEISRIRLKKPAKLIIVIHEDKRKDFNLSKFKYIKNNFSISNPNP